MLPRQEIEKSNNVKSVLKGLLIMEELDNAGELSLGELSERLSMDKATVHRIINTIKDAGFINQNRNNKKYSNSLKLLAMGNRVMEKSGIKHIARPFMEDLAEKTRETINLGVIVDSKVIYIDKLESNSTIKVGLGIGTSVPIYCSGLGKAMLAFMHENELCELLKNICYEKFTDNSIENEAQLLKVLSEIRNQDKGFSIDDEEYVVGLICFGAPIFDYHGRPIAAISISCPKYRYEESKHLEMYSRLVVDAAKNISSQIGYK